MGRLVAKFVYSRPGMVALRNSPEIQQVIKAHASKMASAAASKATYKHATYGSDVKPGKSRAHARAMTTSRGAYWDEFVGGKPLKRSISK